MALDKEFLEIGREAHKDAFRTLSPLRGKSQDPDLDFYKNLTNENFQTIVSEYGLTSTSQYIIEMEQKLIRERD